MLTQNKYCNPKFGKDFKTESRIINVVENINSIKKKKIPRKRLWYKGCFFLEII